MDKGTLYIIGTPIGNLNDITDKVIQTIEKCDIIFCEDSRITGKILNKYNISKKIYTLRDDNEQLRTKKIIDLLNEGMNIGILSDAGMPLISDPGYKVVNKCLEKDINIQIIHGPTAFLDALIKAGMPTDNFWFVGFFPKKLKKRKEIMDIIDNHDITLIFYESPFRIKKTINFLKEELTSNFTIAVCRELTKIHEEIIKINLEKLRLSDIIEKGEFVVLLRRNK